MCSIQRVLMISQLLVVEPKQLQIIKYDLQQST